MPSRSSLVRAYKAVAGALIFGLFWLGAVLCNAAVFPLLGLCWRSVPPATRRARFQAVARRGYAAVCHAMRWAGVFDFDPRRAGLELPAGPFVLVANHPTLIDVVALTSVHGRLCCVAKPPLFRNPLIGRLLRELGHIRSAAPDAPMAGAAVMAAARDRLREGCAVLIFPEGTRSPAGEIGRLSRGAFEIAARAGVPLVPLFITCQPPVLARGMAWYEAPAPRVRYALSPLPVVAADRLAGDTAVAAQHHHDLWRARLAGSRVAPSAPHPVGALVSD